MKLFSESVSVDELERFFLTAFDYNVRFELDKIKQWKKPKPTTISLTRDMYAILTSRLKKPPTKYRDMSIEFLESKRIIDFKLK